MLKSKILLVLGIIALLLGIAAEIVIIRKNVSEGDVAAEQAKIQLETARQAARKQNADADKAEAEALLTKAKAETARQEALNAELRQKAEAEKARTQADGAALAKREFERSLRDPAGYARDATNDGLREIDRATRRNR